jgi:hypothetical protein
VSFLLLLELVFLLFFLGLGVGLGLGRERLHVLQLVEGDGRLGRRVE